ncbi:DUF5700 domain-containing putative Zn-dependent protease [Sphingobacterium corticis]|uniref:DUF5700 domain-containing putative Zn-dependent protease n=1 Tax=Sphingobacterium corticis TaxID=1812823 RepID=A0ABW5NK19_9SPHI
MRHFYFCLGIFLLSNNLSAQHIDIRTDTKSAEAIISLLDRSPDMVSNDELIRISKLPGNQHLIEKVKGSTGAGSDVFISTLKELIETGDIEGDDKYQWKFVKQSLPKIRGLLQKVNSSGENLSDDIASRIKMYTPDKISLKAQAYFIVGGDALGFTLDGESFHVALQNIGDDYEGLKVLMMHELYHNIQNEGLNLRERILGEKPSYNEKATYALLYELWSEGLANFVGDYTKIEQPGEFARSQIAVYEKNDKRNRSNFYLFETLLYRAFHDPKVSYGQLYNIGFTTEFDEVFYAVGYEMAKQLVSVYGNQVVKDLVLQDPVRFVSRYIELYQQNPSMKLVPLSKETEDLISKMLTWENRI